MSASEFVSTYFTQTYLFLYLNLIIGTIYITSRLAKPHPPRQAPPLSRAPSSLIDRVRSIDLSFYKFESHPEPDPLHYHYSPGMDLAVVDGPAEDHAHGPVRRMRSDSERMGEQGPKPRMRKMASEKSAAAAAVEDNFEVEKIDAKADDFIQRFRQQLGLQRLDSLMRYKDLLTGGGAGTAR